MEGLAPGGRVIGDGPQVLGQPLLAGPDDRHQWQADLDGQLVVPLIVRGELYPMSTVLFFSQIIGPAQVFCRAWLSGRHQTDPRGQADTLIACAVRALATPDNDGEKK